MNASSLRPAVALDDPVAIRHAGRELLGLALMDARNHLLARLAQDDYSHGCQGCKWEIDNEGREGSYPQTYEDRANHLTADPASGAWPRSMEFNLSNSCNLQCIQCNGDLSSSIRLHREKRPPFASPYGDAFFEELASFLPHLTSIKFLGGEPFLASETLRVMEMLVEGGHRPKIHVTTNGTQWDEQIEHYVSALEMQPGAPVNFRRHRADRAHHRALQTAGECGTCHFDLGQLGHPGIMGAA